MNTKRPRTKRTVFEGTDVRRCWDANRRKMILHGTSDVNFSPEHPRRIKHAELDDMAVLEVEDCGTVEDVSLFDKSTLIVKGGVVGTVHAYGHSRVQVMNNARVVNVILHGYSTLSVEDSIVYSIMTNGSNTVKLHRSDTTNLRIRSASDVECNHTGVERLEVDRNASVMTWRSHFGRIINHGFINLTDSGDVNELDVRAGRVYTVVEDNERDFPQIRVLRVFGGAEMDFASPAHIGDMILKKGYKLTAELPIDDWTNRMWENGKRIVPIKWAIRRDQEAGLV